MHLAHLAIDATKGLHILYYVGAAHARIKKNLCLYGYYPHRNNAILKTRVRHEKAPRGNISQVSSSSIPPCPCFSQLTTFKAGYHAPTAHVHHGSLVPSRLKKAPLSSELRVFRTLITPAAAFSGEVFSMCGAYFAM